MLKRNEESFDKMLTIGNEKGWYDLQCPLGFWGAQSSRHCRAPTIASSMLAHKTLTFFRMAMFQLLQSPPWTFCS